MMREGVLGRSRSHALHIHCRSIHPHADARTFGGLLDPIDRCRRDEVPPEVEALERGIGAVGAHKRRQCARTAVLEPHIPKLERSQRRVPSERGREARRRLVARLDLG